MAGYPSTRRAPYRVAVDLAAFQRLLTPEGQAVLAEVDAADVSDSALLATASRLRDKHEADLVGAALTQARLRVRAKGKFGANAARMYFTPDGLEQATRPSVAGHRARRFAARLGGGAVLDLGCGIGGDLLARARAGGHGIGVDLDPLTVSVAEANLRAAGLDHLAAARTGDAREQDPAAYAGVFADPARRTALGRVFAPEAYEPPLSTVIELVRRAPAGCVKVAPGIPHEAIPPDAGAEWISEGGEVKEAALWFGALAGPARRQATVLRPARRPGHSATLSADPGLGAPPVSGWRRYLYEPDGAVIRAGLVAEVAALLDGALADPRIAYITADSLRETPFARAYKIREVLPFSVKRLRAALRAYGAGALTIKKRGFAGDVEKLRRDLRTSGSAECVVVLTRVGDAPVALICEGRGTERAK